MIADNRFDSLPCQYGLTTQAVWPASFLFLIIVAPSSSAGLQYACLYAVLCCGLRPTKGFHGGLYHSPFTLIIYPSISLAICHSNVFFIESSAECVTDITRSHVLYPLTLPFWHVPDYCNRRSQTTRLHWQRSRPRSLRSPVSSVSMMAQSSQSHTSRRKHPSRRWLLQRSNARRCETPSGECLGDVRHSTVLNSSGSSSSWLSSKT